MLADFFRKLLKRNFFQDVPDRILILSTTLDGTCTGVCWRPTTKWATKHTNPP